MTQPPLKVHLKKKLTLRNVLNAEKIILSPPKKVTGLSVFYARSGGTNVALCMLINVMTVEGRWLRKVDKCI
jgi:hypothetical protein